MNILQFCKKSSYFNIFVFNMIKAKNPQDRIMYWDKANTVVNAYFEMKVLTDEEALHLSGVLTRLYFK